MISIVALIVLGLRYRYFVRLAKAAPSDLTSRMVRYSNTAFLIYIGITVLSFVPYMVFGRTPRADTLCFAIGIGGLFIAAGFDFAAERVKRRTGLTKQQEKELKAKGKAMLKEEEQAGLLLSKATKAEVKADFDTAVSLYQEIMTKYSHLETAKDARIALDALQKRRAG